MDPMVKEKLAAQFQTLDPVRLLQQIRIASTSGTAGTQQTC